MKVLQVFRLSEGGVDHYVSVLLAELQARGWSVDVACSPGSLADELRSQGVTVFSVPLSRKVSPLRDLVATLKLLKIIRREKYSLVHVHSAKAGVVGRVAAFVGRTPVVHTPNAWSFLASESKLVRQAHVAIEWVLALVSSRIICVSSEELELGRRLVRAGRKLRLVPNGIAPPPPTVRSPSNKEYLLLGTLTRLTRQKGLDYLIRAAEAVCAERVGVRFSVAGDGPDFERLKAQAERRGLLRDRFEFVGFREPWGYLEEIDVFVLPSLWEGMPFALLEAMGRGLPVVATDVGGVRDLIPDETYGMVVPPADSDALRKALLRYVDAPQIRESTGASARRRVLNEFNQERMTKRTLDVYSEVLRG